MTKILDCTIRDGGHLNGWNFSEECVLESYEAAFEAGADYFEIGYRNNNRKPEWGKFYECEDEYLFSLFSDRPKLKLGVMIDTGKSELKDFKECSPQNTPISFVRVATHRDKLDSAFLLCEGLKTKGYEVILNLMAFSEYQNEDFEKIKIRKIPETIDSVCFADSFGSFMPDDILKYKTSLEEVGFEKICFHAHNNLQLGFANSLEAIKNNFYCIDASIYGMGRCAGILPIELITGYLNKHGNKKYNPVPYIKVIQKYYEAQMSKTPWGYGLPSLFGGLKNIHPIKVKELFTNPEFIYKSF